MSRLIFLSYYHIDGRVHKHNSVPEDDRSSPLVIGLRTIKAATGNFSDEFKLGEGGFGPVYKVSILGAHYKFSFL